MIIRAKRRVYFKRTCVSLFKHTTRLRWMDRSNEADIGTSSEAQLYLPVTWTHCQNLPSQSFDQAYKIMQATANQSIRCKRPVYSLSFQLRQQDTDYFDQNSLLKISSGLITKLGLSEHQCLFIGPSYRSAPVVHAIVNRVHPETCRAAELKNDHFIISTYAQRVEKTLGMSREERRAFNNALRERGEFVKWSASPTSWPRIAWTTDQFAQAIEVAADQYQWPHFISTLERFGLTITAYHDRFIIENRVNHHQLQIKRGSGLYLQISEILERYRAWIESFDIDLPP